MNVKYLKALQQYKYILMFDLASKNTGVCLWEINKNSPVQTFKICVNNMAEWNLELYNKIDLLFQEIYNKGILKEEILVYKEAMPTQIGRNSSTIQTFVALAKSHAILDLYLQQNDIDEYDEIGVYPITTHAYYKKLKQLPNNTKVEKEDIKQYVEETYGFQDLTYDESDAVFLALTFLMVKWDRDIKEKIKEIKKHKKTLKAPHAIKACDDEIILLEGRLRHEPENGI